MSAARHLLLTIALLLMPQGLLAELVLLRLNQQVDEGESIFVTSELPMMGAGDVRQALRMVPGDGGEWRLPLDLPPGIEIRAEYYIRRHALSALFDGSNGRKLPGRNVIRTKRETAPPTQFTVHPGFDAREARAVVVSQAPGFAPAFFNLLKIEDSVLFRGAIPATHINHGRQFLLELDRRPINSRPLRLTSSDMWYRHDQFFRYEPRPLPPSPPRVETFIFAPLNFAERTIRVLLPRGYDEQPGHRYPVIYAQDGQNVFAPGGAFGSWDLDLTINEMTRNGEMPEVILVGIDNSSDRIVEYTPGVFEVDGSQGRGREFLEMIREELMPEVNSRYRTKAAAEHTLHIGSSLGGILGYEAANHMKDTFGTVIAMSPAFWVVKERALKESGNKPNTRARLYIDSGTAGKGADDFANTMLIRDTLIKSGHALGPNFFHVVGYQRSGAIIEQSHNHNEAAWRERAPDALRWAFNGTP